jgi:hypothetical protein
MVHIKREGEKVMGVRVRTTRSLPWTWRDRLFWGLVTAAGVVLLFTMPSDAAALLSCALPVSLRQRATQPRPKHAMPTKLSPRTEAIVDAIIATVNPIAWVVRALVTLVRTGAVHVRDYVRLAVRLDADAFWIKVTIITYCGAMFIIGLLGMMNAI